MTWRLALDRRRGDRRREAGEVAHAGTLATTTGVGGADETLRARVATEGAPAGWRMPPPLVCSAKSLDGERYLLETSLEDSWLSGEDQNAAAKGLPQFRSFRISNETAILRDGQTTQLTTAADKANGETVRIDVALNVIK